VNQPDSNEFKLLKSLSSQIGNNPALVQGAGGNTSLKVGDVMWIKASGTWLMHAAERDIMVPVQLNALQHAIKTGDPAADTPHAFTVTDLNPAELRPSIESTLHAVMPQPVVVHAHCVETISIAVRSDVEERLADLLDADMDYIYVPYARPGLPLAQSILERMTAKTNVIVLGNHGVVVAANTVVEADELLQRISQLLRQPERPAPALDIAALDALMEDTDYQLPYFVRSHAVACDSISCSIAVGGSLYPDHVIFLGPGSVVAKSDESIARICERESEAGLPRPVALLFPGKGVLMHKDADDGAQAMAQCLSDVTSRIEPNASVDYLSMASTAELMNWDAEKYRQSLNIRPDFDAAAMPTDSAS